MRQINRAGLEIIKSFEGLRLKPYLCPAGVPTIGYGTTVYPDGKPVKLSDPPVTPEQAEAYLLQTLKKFEEGVSKLVTVSINDNEFSALVSFAYNVGLEALKKSTLLKLLNAGVKREAVADQLLRWNKAGGKELPGLTRRRQAERSLFLQPVIPDADLFGKSPSEKEIQEKLSSIERDILS